MNTTIAVVFLLFSVLSFIRGSISITSFVLGLLILLVCLAVAVLAVFEVPLLFWDSPYFYSFSSDSIRYYNEILMFTGAWFQVDEFGGRFHDYLVSPKLGFSVLLSFFNTFLALHDKFSMLIMLNFIVGCFLWLGCHQFLAVCGGQRGLLFAVAVFLLFFFPTDLYWLLRFTRESLANALLVLGLVGMLGSIKGLRGATQCFAIAIIFLFLVRAQVGILLAGYAFVLVLFLKPRPFGRLLVMGALVLFAIAFSVNQSGKGLLIDFFEIFGLGQLVVISYLFTEGALNLVFLLTVGGLALTCISRPGGEVLSIGIATLHAGLAVFGLLVCMVNPLDIRLTYPIFIFSKFCIVVFLVSNYVEGSRVRMLVRRTV